MNRRALTILTVFARGMVRAVLRAHPREFRRRFGDDVLDGVTSDIRQAAGAGSVAGIWAAMTAIVDAIAGMRVARGHMEATMLNSRDVRRFGGFEALTRDASLVIRSLRRRPGFFAAAVATLGLGIGASTAIFSVAYGVTLRPLPYPDAGRLVRIYESRPATSQFKHDVSVGAFDEWRKDALSVEGMALFTKTSMRSIAGPGRDRVIKMAVSPAFFDVLGVRPLLGNGFKPEREYTRFTTTDVVLSYRAWQRLLPDRADPIGAIVTLAGVGDDDRFTVVGVMPPDFEFVEPVDLWTPEVIESSFAPRLRGWRYDRVLARLKPEANIAQTRTELEATAARLAAETPAASAGWTVHVESMHDSIVGAFGRATSLLLAAVIVVLLVACLNVGGLFVARAISRDHETAVRISLGAGPWRLLQLRLLEAIVICGAGTAVGLLLASLSVSALRAAAPPGIPRIDAVAIDGPVLALSLLAMTAAAVVFTVGPLGRVARRDITNELRLRAGTTDRARHSVRIGLTVAQCAGAATLVVLGVMLTRSFDRLTAADLGWSAGGVISVQATPTSQREVRRPWFARVIWADAVIAALETTPGVGSAAVTTQVPFTPAANQSSLARGRGRKETDGLRWSAVAHKVTDRYFNLMRMPIVTGRGFDRNDRFTEAQMIDSEQRPERGVAIITRHTAATLWPGESPIGRPIWFPDVDNVLWREVVGVVPDIQFASVGEAPGLHVFVPWTQDSASARVFVLVQASEAGAPSAAAIRDIVRGVAPGADVDEIASLASLVDRATAQPRFTSRVVAAFALLALTLAAVGIYGTLSYLVGTRTREIGVRLALGASTRDVFADVLRRGLLPALGGGVAGLLLALALAHVFRALFFAIDPIDPASLAGGAATLIAVAAAAAAGPARRAARVDPVSALRSQ